MAGPSLNGLGIVKVFQEPDDSMTVGRRPAMEAELHEQRLVVLRSWLTAFGRSSCQSAAGAGHLLTGR